MNRKKAYLFAAVAVVALPLAVSVGHGSFSWLKSDQDTSTTVHKTVKPEFLTFGDLSYEVRYQSAEKRKGLSGQDSIVPADEELIVYELRISSEKEKDLLKKDKENRIRYFGNLIANDVQLVIGKDTASCLMAHIERTYGLVPYLSVQIAFPPQAGWKEQPHSIILYDRYFSRGPMVLSHQLKENEI